MSGASMSAGSKRVLIGSRRTAPNVDGKPGKWEDREWCWVADPRDAKAKEGTPQLTNYLNLDKSKPEVPNVWEIISWRWFTVEESR